MTTPDDSAEGLAAALIQISAHAERIAGLDTREAAHYEEIATLLGRLADEMAALPDQHDADGIDLTRQASILQALDALEEQVAGLTRHLAQLADDEDADEIDSRYQPVPVPRWWKLTGSDRDDAVGRLRAWVDQIYRPGYGQLAAMLPPCWDQHPFCLYTLDWLSELWSALYVDPSRDGRDLAAQAEWQTRLLTAAAEQMAYEAAGCQHYSPATCRPVTPSHRPGPELPQPRR
jgi:hypothetical protein